MAKVSRQAHPADTRAGGRRGDTNAQRVVDALRAQGPTSQASLARGVRLSPATVSGIVKRLREQGVAEVQPLNKRESLVSLVSTQGALISMQVSVGSIRGALFDFASGVRVDVNHAFDEHSSGGSPQLLAGMIRELAARAGFTVADLMGIAVGIQGPINRSTGALASWARLQLPLWRDIPLADRLSELLRVAVYVENDANLAALAEWTWGVGRGCTDFLYLMCSAGIGGGLVLGGQLYRGGDGLAGEIGHIVLDSNGPVCFCGSRGCLTTFASERAILQALESSGTAVQSLPQVIAAAQHGDPACQAVLWESGRHLGRAIANAAKVIAPSVIAIGGILADADPFVFDSLSSAVEINSLRAVSPTIQILPAQVRDDTTVLGGVAAVLADAGQGISITPEWMTGHREVAAAAS